MKLHGHSGISPEAKTSELKKNRVFNAKYFQKAKLYSDSSKI